MLATHIGAGEKSSVPPASPRRTSSLYYLALLFLVYFIIATLYYAPGVNLFTHLISAGDGLTAGYPSKLFAIQLSAWNPYVQMGQFSFANTQFQPFYPPALLIMMLLPCALGYNIFILAHYGLAGLFFYLFAENLGLRRYAAFAGGLMFMLSGFLSSHMGHQAMMSAAVWLPCILLFIDRYSYSGRVIELAGGAIAVAMALLAGFPQVTVYGLSVVGGYTVFRLRPSVTGSWRTAIRRTAVCIFYIGAVAGLLSSLQLFAVIEALPHMTREKLTYAMFSEDSLPFYQVLSLAIPNLFGGFYHTPSYSESIYPGELYGYMGLLPLALAIFAFKDRRKTHPDVTFWTTASLAALLLSFGRLTPLHGMLFHVPVYNLFRAPCRHLYELDFGIAVLGTFGVSRLLETGGSTKAFRTAKRTCWLVLAFFGGVYSIACLIRFAARMLALPQFGGLLNIPLNALATLGTIHSAVEKNLTAESPTILFAVLAFIATIAVFLLLASAPEDSPRRRIALILFFPVIIIDVFLPFSTLYRHPSVEPIGRDYATSEFGFLKVQHFNKEQYRILPLDHSLLYSYPLLNMPFEVNVTNDYTPMWLKRVVAVTGFGLDGSLPLATVHYPNALSVAGTQYLMAREKLYVDALRRTYSAADYPTTLVVSNPSLLSENAEVRADGSCRLRSADGEAVSIAWVEIPLAKSSYYRITFMARAEGSMDSPLFLNLYNEPGYNSQEQYHSIPDLSRDFRRHVVTLNSGSAAPAKARLRMFTLSKQALEIRDLSISVMSPEQASQNGPKPIFQEVETTADGITIFRNPEAQPRFRFVSSLRPSKDLGDARAVLLGDPTFDIAREAMVEGLREPISVDPGEVLSSRIDNNDMNWSVRTGRRSFFVVGDSWFPGWKASIDGKSAEIRIVDGFLRGLLIEGTGTHNVQMSFHPWSVPAGIAAMLFGLAMIVGTCWRDIKIRKRLQAWSHRRRRGQMP